MELIRIFFHCQVAVLVGKRNQDSYDLDAGTSPGNALYRSVQLKSMARTPQVRTFSLGRDEDSWGIHGGFMGFIGFIL
jgi:hypothetical protein